MEAHQTDLETLELNLMMTTIVSDNRTFLSFKL